MLKIRPSDLIVRGCNGYTAKFYTTGDYFMAYEWFCRKLLEWKENPKYELLNATSSINNSDFDRIFNENTPLKRLAYMLTRQWDISNVDDFLCFLKIKKWSDLDKPIFIKGRRPTIFPKSEWFKMSGRIINHSPNDHHPKAVYVDGFSLRFSSYKKRWTAQLHYDYQHGGGSCWTIDLAQNYGEHLDSFAKRIQQWMTANLIPENDPRERQYREELWSSQYSAIRELFYGDMMWENEIVDSLVRPSERNTGVTTGKFRMTNSRLATLKRWAAIDKERK